jgi:hypothetical protein
MTHKNAQTINVGPNGTIIAILNTMSFITVRNERNSRHKAKQTNDFNHKIA